MPPTSPDRIVLLKKAGIAALMDGIKAVPGVGSLVVAGVVGTGVYLEGAIVAPELPEQTRDALQQLAEDYRHLLAREARNHPDDNTLELALVATLDILSTQGLSAEALVKKANLDVHKAARLTLQRAEQKVEALHDSKARALTERLVADYYRILLGHKEALDMVGVAALQTILARLPDFEAKLQPQLAAILANQDALLNWERVKAWRKAHWPVRPYPAEQTLHPYILKPEYRLAPYTGAAQAQMRDELVAWAQNLGRDDTPPLGMQLYTGPGGAGKTRLLIEAGERLRQSGWAVHFLGESATPKDAAHFLATLTSPTPPTLLILDYVAERETLVQALLGQMAKQRHHRPAPLALLLLERSTPRWFDDLANSIRDPAYVGLPELLALPTIEKQARAIPPISTEEERRALFATAYTKFAQMMQNHQTADTVSPPDLPERPLFVLLLALLAASGEDVAHLDGENQILAATWQRERRLWRQKLQHARLPALLLADAVDFIQDMHILHTLGRVLDRRSHLSPYLQAYFDDDDLHDATAAILKRTLCPRPSCTLHPIAPDPLADDVIERRLAERPELLDLALPTQAEIDADPAAAAAQTWQALTLLQRAAAHPRHLMPDEVHRWADMSAAILKTRTVPTPGLDAQAAGRFLTDLNQRLPDPDQTLFLRPLVAAVREAQLSLVEDADQNERARLLNNLSVAYSALGRREEALAATQEAVEIRRQLAASQPQAFTPDLASSLNNLGNALSDLGRREEALAATQEAVEILRQLAASRPQAFTPDLAASLNNLGAMLSELGRREEALAATQEAVELYRQLAASRPQAFTPDLAMSLNNLGAMLSALGRREEALAATQEAVELYRQLAASRPQAFTPDLAMSLNNLGSDLSDLGRREAALAATQEAVELYRQLAASRPQAFTPDLAKSLNNLGAMLSELGRREEALAATQEAVELYRQLAASRPQAFTSDLAMSLNNLGAMLSALGRREAALAATQEAVEIRRQLAASRPQAFTPDLAMSLNNLGSDLSALGRREAALAVAQESVDIRRQLALQNPDTFLPNLANSLDTLGEILNNSGQSHTALAKLTEAIQLLQPFFLKHPPAFAAWMEDFVRNYREACQAAGSEPDEALLAPVVEALQRLQAQEDAGGV